MELEFRADELENDLSRAIELVPHSALVFDQGGRVLAANRQSSDIFGCAPDELVDQPMIHLLAPSADAGIRKDGASVPVEIGFSVVSHGESRYVIASLVDVTERLNLETRVITVHEEFLGFEHLVADVIANLLGMAPEKVDTAIAEALCRFADTLQLDVAVIWRQTPGVANLVPTHFWVRPNLSRPVHEISSAGLPCVMSQLQAGNAVWFTTLDDIPHEVDREACRQFGLTSAAMVPLPVVGANRDGFRFVAFGSLSAQRDWPAPLIERLRLAAAVIGQALGRRELEFALRHALDEVRQLSAGGGAEHDRLCRDMSRPVTESQSIVLESAAVKLAFSQAEAVAPMPATVLLLGDTGCGKEMFAKAIHHLSPRRHRPMVTLNCAAIPSTLIESELFGRERGAFTDALTRHIGRFEAANHSTLFLDEIGDLPVEVQVKLLRVLQNRVIERLGSNQSIDVDVRIIAATNRNLEKAVQDQTFREDLYYRLNVFPIVVPPLRERVEDIPGLVWAFIDDFSKASGKQIDSISKQSMEELQRYTWPGNVRELRNVVERALIMCAGRHLQVSLPALATLPIETSTILTEFEAAHIRMVLESTNWRVRGAGGAAQRLGLKATTLESRMAKLGIWRTPSRKAAKGANFS
jgi:transcriptional regulator with PAS, ATPase and Fis domain